MKRSQIFLAISILALLLSSCSLSAAAPVNASVTLVTEGTDALSAITTEVTGLVEARQPAQKDYAPASDGSVIQLGGAIRTGDDGRTRVDLSTGTFFRVGPSSLFTLISNETQDNGIFTRLKLEAGKIWIVLSSGSIEIESDSGLAAVRGSYLSMEILPQGEVNITCLEGDCTFTNAAGTINLVAGQSATATNYTSAPVVSKMSHEDFSEWLTVNPEAKVIIPAVTATQQALPVDASATPQPTATASITPTIEITPTYTPLTGVVQADQLSCRYGPGAPYLYEYGLIKGNQVQVLGRNDASSWVYVQFGETLRPCWVNAKFMELSGDIASLESVYPEKASLILFHHPNFPPVKDVEAARNGNQVEITWTGYELALGDRESADSPLYLVEVWTCQGGQIVFTPIGAYEESAQVTDEAGCSEPSHGQVFLAHKDGYVGPVAIVWPQ